jgi:hypothetical protein
MLSCVLVNQGNVVILRILSDHGAQLRWKSQYKELIPTHPVNIPGGPETRVPGENPHSVLRSQRESTHLSPMKFFISLIKNFTTLQPITELRGLHVSAKKALLYLYY